jgi:hypothetical protein
MRRLALISALLLASVSAHAGESRGLVLASSDASAAADIPAPLPPIKKSQEAKSEAKPEATLEARQETRQQQAAVSARPLPLKSGRQLQAGRYLAQEAKARRIAARYGVYW